MSLKIQYIERPYVLRIKGKFCTSEYIKIFDILDDIMRVSHMHAEEYLNDESACNNDEDMFPQPKCLTGRYYINDIFIQKVDGKIEYWIMNHFTEIYNGVEEDYLGLEMLIYVDSNSFKIMEYTDINTSSI